jgi:hypothetical protein
MAVQLRLIVLVLVDPPVACDTAVDSAVSPPELSTALTW